MELRTKAWSGVFVSTNLYTYYNDAAQQTLVFLFVVLQKIFFEHLLNFPPLDPLLAPPH